MIDTRLFLTESWTNDPDRCLEEGIPEDRLEHRKKAELALDMVQLAQANGVNFQWIGGDAFYGDDAEFLRQLDQPGETFMLDIHKDQTIYLADLYALCPRTKIVSWQDPNSIENRSSCR